MNTFRLYIGANNTTKKVEVNVIENVLNKHFDGYTVEKCMGHWLGQKENSVAVTVATEKDLMPVLAELKQRLNQDAIAYHKIDEMRFI